MELLYTKLVNPAKLHEELLANLDGICTGVSLRGERVRVHVVDIITPVQIEQVATIVAAHDPEPRTEDQAASALIASTLFDRATRIAWHEANTANAWNAVEVVQRKQIEWVKFIKLYLRELNRLENGSG